MIFGALLALFLGICWFIGKSVQLTVQGVVWLIRKMIEVVTDDSTV